MRRITWDSSAAGACLGAAQTAWANLAFRPATAGGRLVWKRASLRRTRRASRIFLSSGWYEVKRPLAGFLPLELSMDGRPAGQAAVWESGVPGIFRVWTLPQEPDLSAPDVGQAEALAALLEAARANGVDLVQSWFNMARWTDERLEDLLASAIGEPFGTYVVELDRGLPDLRRGMHTTHRRQMRKAERAGLEPHTRVDVDEFATLMDQTYERGGKRLPFGQAYLRRLIDGDALPLVRIAVSAHGVLQAAVLVPYDRHRGYYLHGASLARPVAGSAITAHLAAMRELQALGVQRYDLGGARRQTTNPRLAGIFRFKRGFGGPFEDSRRWRLPLSPRGRLLLRARAEATSRSEGVSMTARQER